jgi:glycosidase
MDHPAFQLHRAGVDHYADHYERVSPEQDAIDVRWAGDDPPGVCFNWASIPNLNYDSFEVREWMLSVIEEWVPAVDGFRCDVAWGVPHAFWKEVRDRVKADCPEFLLLDETVLRDVAFHENEFDLHYDTDLYYALRGVVTGDAPATELLGAIAASERRGFPDAAAHMRYVENHDEERYAAECDEGTLRPAAAATLTLPGTPMIYYGQERGIPEQRGPMRWHDGDAALTDWHRRLVELRNGLPALPVPGVDPVAHDVVTGEPDRVVAYERPGDRTENGSDGDGALVVVLNFGADPATVTLDRTVGSDNLLDGGDVGVGNESGNSLDGTTVRVASAAVLRRR